MQLNNFTIVRLLLATLVVFGHFKTLPGLSSPSGIHSYADFAVDAFFVVSGYLVYGSFDNLPKISGFYIKRLFRIYPLYLFMILSQAVAMLVLLGGNAGFGDIFKYMASNLVFANFLSPDMGGLLVGQHNPAINPSLWTLKIEAMFYIFVPLIWWFLKRLETQRLEVWGMALIYISSTIFAAIALHYEAATLAKQLPGQMRFFVVGIALYHFRDRFRLPTPYALVMMVVIFIICTYRFHLPFLLPVYPLLVGALVFISVMRMPVIPMKYDMSYGVYLIHAPLIQISLLLGIFADNALFLLLLLAIVYALAFLAEQVIELPMIRYGKKLAAQYSQRLEAEKI
jgi:peptidoglycan/LPS O-acetylase OafA/YrhL